MKTLHIVTVFATALLIIGCESTDSTQTTSQPVNQTGSEPVSQPVNDQMTPSEKRVMELQALDRQYSQGGMPTNEYYMRQQQIMGSY